MQAQELINQIDGLSPRAVETPADAEEVARILKDQSATQCVVVPRGGGTMLDLGTPLPHTDLVVSLDKLNRVIDHQPANLTVRAQAGMTLTALNQALATCGQYLPLDPPFSDRATLGGILATNASGPLRVRFGSARDLLIGLRVALPDGQLVHGGGEVVKNVAGYDLPKLFIGSLGTLGIMTEATFKIVPRPAQTATFVATFDDLTPACQLALRVLRSPQLPFGLEILNPRASADLGLGEHYAALMRYGGHASAVAQQLREVEQWARESGAMSKATNGTDASWWARLSDFIFDKPIVLKLGVQPTQIAEVAAQVEKLARGAIRVQAVGLLYAAVEGDTDHAAETITALREFVRTRGGYLVVQRGPRELRSRVGVWGPARSDLALMQRLKQEFDPHGTLNPGRFVGGI